MADSLKEKFPTCLHCLDVEKKFVKFEEAIKIFKLDEGKLVKYAVESRAWYQLPRTVLINKKRLEEHMKHLCKVPGTRKYVQKKFVRIGEGSVIYSIGHHRFIEMARAAGAVYKLGESQGNTVLIRLDVFDEYMEQFRQKPIEMKNKLWKEGD